MERPEGELMFDAERQALAKRRQREGLARGLLGLGAFLLVAWASVATGLSARLAGWTSTLSGNPWVVVAFYVAVGYLAIVVLALPLRVSARLTELRDGLSRQSWPSWGWDRAKGTALGLLFALAGAEALYWTLRNFGDLWWVVLWALLVGFTLAIGYLAPVLLLPVFYPVRRVEDPELRDRLRQTCERAGIRVLGIYEFGASAKTERGTAALAGLGRTKRILLSDHILAHFAPEEVEGILAHELGHQVQHDSVALLGLSAGVGLLGLFLTDRFVAWALPQYGLALDAVAGLPLFVLFSALFYAAVEPLTNAVSRWREARADRVGARLAGNPRALASALVKLHDRNLADATPHPVLEALFYTHPSGRYRVEALAKMASSEPDY